jgi:AbrB family looped-hinge helix DNA binding protein
MNMEIVVTLNEKSQVVIPKAMRKRLGLKPGDQLTAVVEEDKIILRPKPKNAAARLRGLGKGSWGSRAKIDRYIEKLRDEWKRG